MMSKKPRCPNHLIDLTDCHKGQGICPISGAYFSYNGDEAEKTRRLRVNALGQQEEVSDWDVKGED